MCAYCRLPVWFWGSSSSTPSTPSSSPRPADLSAKDDMWYTRCGRGIVAAPTTIVKKVGGLCSRRRGTTEDEEKAMRLETLEEPFSVAASSHQEEKQPDVVVDHDNTNEEKDKTSSSTLAATEKNTKSFSLFSSPSNLKVSHQCGNKCWCPRGIKNWCGAKPAEGTPANIDGPPARLE